MSRNRKHGLRLQSVLLIGAVGAMIVMSAILYAGRRSMGISNEQPSPTSTSSLLTATPNPTSTPTVLELINIVPPSDIIQEIYYVSIGGGGNCFDVTDPQEDYPFPKRKEIMESLVVDLCNYEPGETISVQVTSPTNVTFEFSQNTGTDYTYDLDYVVGIDDPRGVYTINMSGNGWSIEGAVEVLEPHGARLYWTGNNLVLYKFSPNENVRLFIYQHSGDIYESFSLLGWVKVQVNEKGQFNFSLEKLQDKPYLYYALGDITGQVSYHVKKPTYYDTDFFQSANIYIYCPGSLPHLGIRGGDTVEVVSDTVQTYELIFLKGSMNGQSDPPYKGDRYELIESWIREKGESLQVDYFPPICIHGTLFWPVGDNEYVPESGVDGYYLRPYR
jgi:hypothetical protein